MMDGRILRHAMELVEAALASNRAGNTRVKIRTESSQEDGINKL